MTIRHVVDSRSSSPSVRPSLADHVSTSVATLTANTVAAAFHSAGSDSGDGEEISTLHPRPSSNDAQCSAASALAASTELPLNGCVHKPTRSAGNGRSTAGSNGSQPGTAIASSSASGVAH